MSQENRKRHNPFGEDNDDNRELTLELEIATKNLLDSHRRVPLPLELNCQIFECLKFRIQRKFIGGLGRGIYGIFRQKVLTKSKRVQNPIQNGWNNSSTYAIIFFNELYASDNTGSWETNVFARKGFPISGKLSRPDNFPGTVVYYFEVTQIAETTATEDFGHSIGLSDGNNSDGFWLGFVPNSYKYFCGGYYYDLAGEECEFEWPNELKWKDTENVSGCGILLDPQNKVSVFFTGNGILLDKPIPISPSVDCLYPTVCVCNVSLKANLGTDPTKPFEYDIEKCPGMGTFELN